ncbi:MAG: nuclear transport factor 2 family protein, partial [Acidimicrobiales bacterium]
YINGIDMITCDSDSKITEFKVMIRPLQAIEVIRDQMVAMMAALS